jgi:hypothetical protein
MHAVALPDRVSVSLHPSSIPHLLLLTHGGPTRLSASRGDHVASWHAQKRVAIE